MVSRASSSAVNPLKRVKSTSSVKSCRRIPPVPELIGPQTAHYHAMAAASIAMQRSNQRSSMDLRRSCNASHSTDSEADGVSFRSSRARSIRCTASDTQSQRPFIQCPGSISSPSTDVAARNDPAFNAAAEELTPRMSDLSGIEDSISSAPSSYRKLRKAKSMFSTRKRAMKSSGSTYSPFKSYTCSDSPEMGHLSRATLRRPKSFFGTETGQQPQDIKRIQSQSAAVQLAREQYLRELQQPKQNDGSESIINRTKQHQSRPFKKSLRSSSGWDAENGMPFDTQSMEPNVIHPVKILRSSKSRIFSVSIKNGLKRIFGRGLMAQEEKNASPGKRTHQVGLSDYVSSESTGPTSISNRPVSIRTMRSSDSFGTFSSRATSWTDSTTTNSTATRDAVCERNRLSIIQENGGLPESMPSPSSFHYNDGYSVFRKPLYPGRSNNNAYDIVDSQRVYSALVKHIDESHHHDKGDITPRVGTARRSIYSPSSSVYSYQPFNTIRQIPSEASIRTIRALPTLQRKSPSSQSLISVGSNYRREAIAVTPQEIAHRNENMSRHGSRQSLHQSKSSLFQPYRQMRTEIPNPLIPPQFSSYEQVMDPDDDTESVIISRADAIKQSTVSPSVYSRTTSGGTPRHSESRTDPSFSESSDERGTVTILARERLPYKSKDASGYAWNSGQTKGSAEWKSWMSSQMDLLDTTSDNCAMTHYDRFSNTHYREKTEIYDESKDGHAAELVPASQKSAESHQRPSLFHVDQRSPLVELKPFKQNNFSRPLRLSPDISISTSRPVVRKPSVVARSESPRSVHITPGVSLESFTPTDPPMRSASRSPSASPLVDEKSKSPNLATAPVTPRRALKALRTTITLPNQSEEDTPTRRISDPRKLAPTANFSSVRNRKSNGRVTNENSRGDREDTKSDVFALGDIHSTISSKRMVDIFLSQRRRQMGGAEKAVENAFI